jgi:2,4-dienoyl-CoA reductase-like NADH-dependent reductase (Old Yellow Enzyme family)
MSILFEPVKIKDLELPNRFVRSATYDGMADRNGYVTEDQIALFSDLAEGGVGLIVTGIAYVHPSGRISPFQNAVDGDDCIPGLRRLTAAVHDRGVKIALQLFHAGREAVKFLKNTGGKALAPSFLEEDPYFQEKGYRPMMEDDIRKVISAFGDGARRAREAGFDAVQVHGAHAYLLSQFLSPWTNRRLDHWGGELENRLCFHWEVYRDIRMKVGEDYPVLIKVGVQDGFPGGLDFSEGSLAAQVLGQWGFDALEISSGLRGRGYGQTEFRTKISRVDREAYFREWCREIKGEVGVPVMMVGGLRSLEVMEEVIRNGEADFVSLSRPFIKEPGLISGWKNGDHGKATCVSCNKCFEALLKGLSLRCVNQASSESLENIEAPTGSPLR